MRKTDTKRLFELFDEGLKSFQIKERLGISSVTICTHKKQWRKERGIVKKEDKRYHEWP